jgi:hypothetical protein
MAEHGGAIVTIITDMWKGWPSMRYSSHTTHSYHCSPVCLEQSPRGPVISDRQQWQWRLLIIRTGLTLHGVGPGRVVRVVHWRAEGVESSLCSGSGSIFCSGLLLKDFSTVRAELQRQQEAQLYNGRRRRRRREVAVRERPLWFTVCCVNTLFSQRLEELSRRYSNPQFF